MMDIFDTFIQENFTAYLTLGEHYRTELGIDCFAYEYIGGFKNNLFEPNAVAFPRTNRKSPDHLERGNFHALLHAFPWLIEDKYGDLYVSVLAAPNAYNLQRALNEVESLHEDPIFAESAIEDELSDELDTLWEKSLDPLGWTLADYPTPDLEFGVHYDQYFDGELYLTDEALTLLPETD